MKSMNSTRDTIPVNMISRMVPVFESFSEMMIQMEMEFSESLDVERLSNAVYLALDAEPKLGSYYIDHWRNPYWKRLEGYNGDLLTITRSEIEYNNFRHTGIDAYNGPQIRVCFLESDDACRLLIKASHHVTDAGGVKDITGLIASIYNTLEKNPDYNPEQNMSVDNNMQRVLDTIPKEEFPRLRKQARKTQQAMNPKNGIHRLIFNSRSDNHHIYVTRVLGRDSLSNLSIYRKKYDATLNDILLAAFFRAQTRAGNWDGKRQLCVTTTVDCRRYLPGQKASTITNLAYGYSVWPCLETDLGDGFSDTLKKVVSQTRQRKDNYIGADALIGGQGFLRLAPMISRFKKPLKHFVRMATKRAKAPDALTNMGIIDTNIVDFGIKATKAHLLAPIAHVPFFTLGVSGYDGTLTLSSGIDSSQEDLVNRFFDIMVEELTI